MSKETSLEAYDVALRKAPRDKERIVSHIRERGPYGAICDEVEAALGIAHTTASARIKDLKREGRLIETKGRRLTRSRCKAAVLVVPEYAPMDPFGAPDESEPLHEGIRALRESKGLSRDEVAEKTGIDGTRYLRIEEAKRRPTPEEAFLLGVFLSTQETKVPQPVETQAETPYNYFGID